MVSFGETGDPTEWFYIAEIVDPLIDPPDPDLKRFILKVPDITDYGNDAGDNFMIFGCDLVNGEMFRDGCDEEGDGPGENPWCGYYQDDQYPYPDSKEAWTKAQVKFLFSHNINTIGSRSSFAGYSEQKWYNQNAELRYNQDGTCDDPEEGDFIYYNAGSSVLLHKVVNHYLPGEHSEDPDDYPHPFFPYTAYLYFSQPLKVEISLCMVPDVFSEEFERDAYFRAFLFISDGDPENHGRWYYSENPDLDYAEINAANDSLEVPGFWKCHNPNELCNERALICYNLGFDVPWGWDLKDTPCWIGERRPWIRVLLGRNYDDSKDPAVPPARHKFAELMRDYYKAKHNDDYNDAIAAWNYGDPLIHDDGYALQGFGIDYFCIIDCDEPTGEEVFLETIDSNVPESMIDITRYPPDDCPPVEGSDDNDLRDWLTGDWDSDLGYVLTDEDAGVFKVAISDEYHSIAIDAIRFFDENHLIFSENINWEAMREQDSEHIMLSIANARGHEFTGEDFDAITGQFYSKIPEEIHGNDDYHSYKDEFGYYKDCLEFVFEESGRIMPVLNGEFTSHADWENEMDYNMGIEPEVDPKCPVLEVAGGEKVCFAPFPHGVSQGENNCLNPKNYHYTESGLSDSWVDPDNDVEHLGRGDDYDIATSILLDPVTLGGTDYNLVLGNIYHGYYDHQYENGKKKPSPDSRKQTENWGILSPCMVAVPDGEQQPYLEMTDAIKMRNGPFEENLSGSAWDGSDPDTYETIPEKVPCYEGGGDCPAVYVHEFGEEDCLE